MTEIDCQTCGQRVSNDAYHPHLYCVLYKAGIKDQRNYLQASISERMIQELFGKDTVLTSEFNLDGG